MKKLIIFTFPIILFLLFTAATEAVLVRFNAAVQTSSTSEIKLSWLVSTEDQVEYYILKRKMLHQSEFQDVATIQLAIGKNELDGKLYEFSDKNVFKNSSASEPIVYTLHAFSNGSSHYLAQVDINYTTTAIRRTWGSIKAMFQ